MDKQQQQQHQNLNRFAQDWNNNENLQKEFSKNPEKVCSQYNISGKERDEILKIAKEGKDLKQRISTAMLNFKKMFR